MNLLATVLPWAMAAFVFAMALNAWRLLKGPSAFNATRRCTLKPRCS